MGRPRCVPRGKKVVLGCYAHRNKFALNGSLSLVSHFKRTATVEEAVSLTSNACQVLQLDLEIG